MTEIVEHVTECPVYDLDGNKIGEEEAIEYHQVGNMPCEPGLRTVQWKDGQVIFHNVLFWHVHTAWMPLMKPEVCATPVTHEGAEDGAHVLYPDGKVYGWSEVWDTLDAWVQHQKEFKEEQRRFDEYEAAKKDGNAL